MMLVAALFGTLAASQSISEEIEGRTAVTLMSKPVSRRQFLLGKFLGILMASLLLFALLSWLFEGVLLSKNWLDRADPTPVPAWVTSFVSSLNLAEKPAALVRRPGLMDEPYLERSARFGNDLLGSDGADRRGRRVGHAHHDGRQPEYGIGDLFSRQCDSGAGDDRQRSENASAWSVSELLSFTAGVFDMLLPDLDIFRIGPALVSDAALPASYVLSVLFYGVLYSLIVLLIGLILFEDKDLA